MFYQQQQQQKTNKQTNKQTTKQIKKKKKKKKKKKTKKTKTTIHIKTRDTGVREVACETIVRPQLEYASTMWSPYT